MSATGHITTMGRGIGITACAGIGSRAIGPGVTIIASGFPVTTRPGSAGDLNSVDRNVTDAPLGKPVRRAPKPGVHSLNYENNSNKFLFGCALLAGDVLARKNRRPPLRQRPPNLKSDAERLQQATAKAAEERKRSEAAPAPSAAQTLVLSFRPAFCPARIQAEKAEARFWDHGGRVQSGLTSSIERGDERKLRVQPISKFLVFFC